MKGVINEAGKVILPENVVLHFFLFVLLYFIFLLCVFLDERYKKNIGLSKDSFLI